MAKHFKNEYCVHCGVFYKTLTSDHVFPKSWYPDTTPNKVEKWQIPSCEKCNNTYSRLEEDLLIRIGLCLDPTDFASLGIPDKVLRALNPRYAKSNKDKRVRQAKKDKILREMLVGDNIPDHGFFPNFDKHDPRSIEPKSAILIPQKHIERLAEKIVKGITYLEDKIVIKDPYVIKTFILQDSDAVEYVNNVRLFGKIYSREPGIVVTRATMKDDKVISLYLIEIWARFKLYVIVGDKSIHSFV